MGIFFFFFVFFAPTIFNVGWGAYSITAVRTSRPMYQRINGFRSISFERISVLLDYILYTGI